MHISLFIIVHLTTLILLIEYAKRKENQIICKGSIIPKQPLINIFIYLSYYISLIQILGLYTFVTFFLQGDQPFSVPFRSGGCARAHPPGVAPEASEEWFDSFEVLMPFVMPRPVWLFPHANWP
jgi:hypothetical protein